MNSATAEPNVQNSPETRTAVGDLLAARHRKPILTGYQTELLLTMATINSWSVDENNFLDMAKITALGMSSVYHNGEGLSCEITNKGRWYALKKKLIRPDKEAIFQPYSRTGKGNQYRKKYGNT